MWSVLLTYLKMPPVFLLRGFSHCLLLDEFLEEIVAPVSQRRWRLNRKLDPRVCVCVVVPGQTASDLWRVWGTGSCQSRRLTSGPVSSLIQAYRNKVCNIQRNKGCLYHAEAFGSDSCRNSIYKITRLRCRRKHGTLGESQEKKRLCFCLFAFTFRAGRGGETAGGRRRREGKKTLKKQRRRKRTGPSLFGRNFDRKCNLCPVFFVCVYVCVA